MNICSKRVFIITLLVLLFDNLKAQNDKSKAIVDSSATNNWTRLRDYGIAISNDGAYFSYNSNQNYLNTGKLIVQSVSDSWRQEYVNASKVCFTSDSKRFFFQAHDSLFFIVLKTRETSYTDRIVSFKQPSEEQGTWLAYQLNSENKDLVVENLLTGRQQHYNSITDYSFSKNGKLILLRRKVRQSEHDVTYLELINLSEAKTSTIWTNEGRNNATISNYNIDDSATQVVFSVDEEGITSIWYYKTDMKNAVFKINQQSIEIEDGLQLSKAGPSFSKDGRYIFFRLEEPGMKRPEHDAINLDVWSYRDTILQSVQQESLGPKLYTAVMRIDGTQIIRLEREYDKIKAYPDKGDFVVVGHNTSGDQFWLNQEDSNWLVSMKDGTRKLIKTVGFTQFWFSPNGNYLVYFDKIKDQGNYYSYDLNTGYVSNISANVPSGWLIIKEEYSKMQRAVFPVGLAMWSNNNSTILVYDNYDVWKLYLNGQKAGINITNGYGRSNQIKLRIVNEFDTYNDNSWYQKDTLLLAAFDTKNKYNGFYLKNWNKKGDPEQLTMGPWTLFYYLGRQLEIASAFNAGMKPLKSKKVNSWIVKRQSYSEAPNLFLTNDFRNFKPLTDIEPQKGYNWITAELVSWKQFDGTIAQGVLYKPENFNPKNKYPVIFNYYKKYSERLYQYPDATFMSDNINIPWFVSRGYLVFTPDIHNSKEDRAFSTYNSVVSAAKWIAKFPFVDASKMAINGHSVGGAETNYLVTQCNLFAAALSGAGVSDVLSSALQLGGGGGSRLDITEQNKGKSIWERPDLYLKNSPVLRADKVNTPIIIFHSKADPAVPWEQGVEFFIALRRLGKPVWMLQYDGQGHGNHDLEPAKDYTIRVTQFFDHYLKGAPPPRWMTQGIPARLRGIESRLELDPNGSCGKDCKICKKKNYQNYK